MSTQMLFVIYYTDKCVIISRIQGRFVRIKQQSKKNPVLKFRKKYKNRHINSWPSAVRYYFDGTIRLNFFDQKNLISSHKTTLNMKDVRKRVHKIYHSYEDERNMINFHISDLNISYK